MSANEKYSARLHTGSRTYFFDINQGKTGDVRLEVSESRRRGEKFERDRVIVYEEDIARFVDELLKAVSHMPEAHGQSAVRPHPEQSESKATRLEEIRAKHVNAYAKWTPEEDAQLVKELASQTQITEIAQIHGRQPSAIRSRVRKLTG